MKREVTYRTIAGDHWLKLVEATTKVRGKICKWTFCSRKYYREVQDAEAVIIVPFVFDENGKERISLVDSVVG